MSKDFKQDHMMKLQGKDYLPVAPRVLMFRKDHPEAVIHTQVQVVGEDTYVYAIVGPPGMQTGAAAWATAHKRVKKGGKGPAAHWPLETAETGAIGRALALCGYGTLAGELDEGDQLADAPVESATPPPSPEPVEEPAKSSLEEIAEQMEKDRLALQNVLSAVACTAPEDFEARKVEWREFAKTLNEHDREVLKDAVLNRAAELRDA